MNIAKSITDLIGNTPLLELQNLSRGLPAHVAVKLEFFNPGSSVKDRIALAMVAAVKGYRMVLIMPETQSLERRQSMQAYGAELVLVSKEEGMEGARDLALAMQAEGRGRVLDQFSNDDNWRAHYRSTGPEIWRQTAGSVTHFVSAMGTTGTITGVSRFLKEQREAIRIIGAQPAEGASIAGIRAWPPGYEPAIRAQARIDRVEEVSQQAAEDSTLTVADVRIGNHPDEGYSRFVVEFDGQGAPGWSQPQWDVPASTMGKGDPIEVEGTHTMVIRGSGVAAVPPDGQRVSGHRKVTLDDSANDDRSIDAAYIDPGFEGEFQVVVGTGSKTYRIFSLTNPTRLVVDIAHS